MRSYRPTSATDAIVLRLRDYADSDRIVTLLTLDYGKVTALAKGAKRSRKRFGGALSPFGYGSALLKERPGRDLWVLEELQSVSGFSSLPLEMGRFAQASYACELVQELVPAFHPEPELFEHLRSFLGQLNELSLQSKPPLHVLFSFEIGVLRHAGWQLSLRYCAVCALSIDGASEGSLMGLDMEMGGILCGECHRRKSGIRTISEQVWQALVWFEKQSYPVHRKEPFPYLSFSRETLRVCREILLWVIEHHLGKNLRTVSFIQQMNTTIV